MTCPHLNAAGYCDCPGSCCIDAHNSGRCKCSDCACQTIGQCEGDGGCARCRPTWTATSRMPGVVS